MLCLVFLSAWVRNLSSSNYQRKLFDANNRWRKQIPPKWSLWFAPGQDAANLQANGNRIPYWLTVRPKFLLGVFFGVLLVCLFFTLLSLLTIVTLLFILPSLEELCPGFILVVCIPMVSTTVQAYSFQQNQLLLGDLGVWLRNCIPLISIILKSLCLKRLVIYCLLAGFESYIPVEIDFLYMPNYWWHS